MSQSSSDDLPLPTRRQLYGYSYTAKEQAEKDYTMKQLIRDYPNTPPLWCEYVYDFCKNTPQEILDEIMESGKWDGPGKFTNKNLGSDSKEQNDTSNCKQPKSVCGQLNRCWER